MRASRGASILRSSISFQSGKIEDGQGADKEDDEAGDEFLQFVTHDGHGYAEHRAEEEKDDQVVPGVLSQICPYLAEIASVYPE